MVGNDIETPSILTGLRVFDAESSKVAEAMNAWREEYTKQLGDTANEEEIAKVIILELFKKYKRNDRTF